MNLNYSGERCTRRDAIKEGLRYGTSAAAFILLGCNLSDQSNQSPRLSEATKQTPQPVTVNPAAKPAVSEVDPKLERYNRFHIPTIEGKVLEPTPYIALPFASGTKFKLVEGWISSDEEFKDFGIRDHLAVDWEVEQGTPVYAPFAGYYLASYQFLPNYIQRIKEGVRIYVSFGRFIQRINPELNRYMQIAHLLEVDEAVPWARPVFDKADDTWNPPLLYIPRERLAENTVVRFFEVGTRLGRVGASGMFRGEARDFEGEPTRKSIRELRKDEVCDDFHVHFEEFGRRDVVANPDQPVGQKFTRRDPYGIYGKANEGYPQYGEPLDLSKKPLILTGPDRKPLFAR